MEMNLSYYRGRSAEDPCYARYEAHRIQTFIRYFGEEILDVGAGDPFHLDLLSQDHGRRGAAMEVNPVARKALEEAGYMTYPSLEAVDRQFDTVFFAHVIEHVSPGSIYDFFARITALIKPGGTCFIISPVSKWFWDTPDHYRIYDRAAIRALFRDNGLKEELAVYQGSQHVAARVLRTLGIRERVFRSDVLFPAYFRLSNYSRRDLIMVGRKPQ